MLLLMRKPPLARHASDAWRVVSTTDAQEAVLAVDARAGTVVGAGETLMMLRAGDAGLRHRPTPEGMGDAVAVAIDTRKKGRFAVSGVGSITVFEGEQRATVELPRDHAEPLALAWASSGTEDATKLHVLFDDGSLMRFDHHGGGFDTIELPDVHAIATDESGALAIAAWDEDAWELIVLVRREGDNFTFRRIEAPSTVAQVDLAIAGTAVAVSFQFENVYLARDLDAPFAAVPLLSSGGPVAFEGTDANAPLFGVIGEGDEQSIVRITPEGDAATIVEMTVSNGEAPRIRQLAWDASRRTLWAAACRAGLVAATAPGSPPAMGREAGAALPS